jgi:hypothetical protein
MSSTVTAYLYDGCKGRRARPLSQKAKRMPVAGDWWFDSSRTAAGRTCLGEPYTLIQTKVKRTLRGRTPHRVKEAQHEYSLQFPGDTASTGCCPDDPLGARFYHRRSTSRTIAPISSGILLPAAHISGHTINGRGPCTNSDFSGRSPVWTQVGHEAITEAVCG